MGDSGHRGGQHNNGTRDELHRGKKRPEKSATSPDAYKPEATFSPPVDTSPPDLGASLLKRHYDGDDDAFDEFVRMYQPWMKKPIHSFAKQLELDDVVQSVLVRIFEQRSQVPHSHPSRAQDGGADPACGTSKPKGGLFHPAKGTVKGWLCISLIHEALSELRWDKRHPSSHLEELFDAPGYESHIEDEISLNERRHQLPHRLQAVLNGLEADKTYQEIARELTLSLGTVFNRVRELKQAFGAGANPSNKK